MIGRGFRGYLAMVRADEHDCACGHVRRRHALVFGRRASRHAGRCERCDCARFIRKRAPEGE